MEFPFGHQLVAIATFVADTMTPVRAYAAALRRAAGDAASFLLESVVGGERWGRYCILGYRPKHEATLQASGHLAPAAHGLPHGMRPAPGARDALDAARSLFEPSADESDDPIDSLLRASPVRMSATSLGTWCTSSTKSPAGVPA